MASGQVAWPCRRGRWASAPEEECGPGPCWACAALMILCCIGHDDALVVRVVSVFRSSSDRACAKDACGVGSYGAANESLTAEHSYAVRLEDAGAYCGTLDSFGAKPFGPQAASRPWSLLG